MVLFVCPQCEVLYEMFSYVAKHTVCSECGFEGSLYLQSSWPVNHILGLLKEKELYTDTFCVAKERQELKLSREFQQKIRDLNGKIDRVCQRYNLDINEIAKTS